jgi:metallo-beta-lactamase family protein
MMENGRILHHLAQGASDPRNTILVVGFQAEHTLGRRVVERQPILQIFGEDVPLHAHVEVIDGYSAHADRTEMMAWLARVKEKSPGLDPIWLVHGEAPVQDEFRSALIARGYNVECPEPRTTHSF